MRIRKAAIAGATALAVAFSGTAVASAETEGDQAVQVNRQEGDTTATSSDKEDKGGSSKIGNDLWADSDADGTKIFGKDTDLSSQPAWAQALYGIGIASAVITVIGGLVGPALNFIKFGPIKF